jgi:putative endonuclease
MSGADKKQIGQLGEDLAVKFLAEQGYEILERNFKTRAGEVDIIAREADTLVFVEVKRFSRPVWSQGPLVNLTPDKQRRVIRAAKGFLARLGRDDFFCRFDVVTVQGVEIELFRGAFSA